MNDPLQSTSQPSAEKRFPVVGMGGSAGSLDAFGAFFRAVPQDPGVAFVLLAHLDPKHVSLLPQLLQKDTGMPVRQIEDGMFLLSDHVYVIPPNKDLRIEKGRLQLTDLGHMRAASIDFFLESLAADYGPYAIGIIFSGMGADGAKGIKEIKSNLGMIMVQDEPSAQYTAMPRSAIATGVADYVLPPEKMPEQLLGYVKHLLAGTSYTKIRLTEREREALQKIVSTLRARTRQDFSHYKTTTLWRRIERRMHLHRIDDIDAYARYLQESNLEVDNLFGELLIGVTCFFRDLEAFETLQQKALLDLLQSKPEGYALRVWIPGCSSGEEAYSIAILLHECLYQIRRHCNVQVFATDIDKNAIESARAGIYPAAALSQLNPERLKNYFTVTEDGQYQVAGHIREMLLFAPQNVISDPPFTKLDLISCRNLLIYLDTEMQRKLISLFHYSLKPGGILFLGASETVHHELKLFSPLDTKWKIFKKSNGSSTYKPFLELPVAKGSTTIISDEIRTPSADHAMTVRLIETILQQSNVPPCVIIDEGYNVVYVHGHTGKFLEPAEGQANMNIFKMARPGLKAELINAIRAVSRSQQELVRSGIRITDGEEMVSLDLVVKPVFEQGLQPGINPKLMMVIFKEKQSAGKKKSKAGSPSNRSQTAEEFARELEHTKQTLQAAIEQLEVANEELRSSNEELQSTNEELQSTNEELETSKEELQSLNEESSTVNAEMQNRIEELSQAHDDIKNLMDSTEIATVFLDAKLCVRRFTPTATDIIHLVAADTGRPIKHFAVNLIDVDLDQLARQVLGDLAIRTAEVAGKTDCHYLLRARPYRTVNNVIDGVVITFEDITDLKQVKSSLQESEQRLSMAFRATNDTIWDYDFVQGRAWSNEGYTNLFGNRPRSAQDSWQWWADHIHPEDRNRVTESCQAALDGDGDRWSEQYRHKRKDGTYAYLIDRAYIARDSAGKATRMIGAMVDITEQKQMLEEVSKQRNMLRIVLDTTPCMIVFKDTGSVYRMVNRAFCEFLRMKEEDIIGLTDLDLFPRAEAEVYRRDDAQVMESGIQRKIVETVTGAMGELRLEVTKTPVFDSYHKCIGVLASARESGNKANEHAQD